MPFDPNEYRPERVYMAFIEAGEAWADAQHACDILVETRKPVLAELKLKSAEKSDVGRETEALASAVYREHILKLTDAQHQCNIMRVRFDAIKALADARRTQQATMRSEHRFVEGGGAG